jgi:hypothetical protein
MSYSCHSFRRIENFKPSQGKRHGRIYNNDPKGPRAPPIERARRDQPKNIYLDQAKPKAEAPTRQQNLIYIHHHYRLSRPTKGIYTGVGSFDSLRETYFNHTNRANNRKGREKPARHIKHKTNNSPTRLSRQHPSLRITLHTIG